MKAGIRLWWACTSWLAISVSLCAAAWPNTPFKASGRWITDASGNNVTHSGVNWPGHGEVMIPEGLQHQPIPAIVSKIKSLGMNAIRLTYAIEMIDQIYENEDKDVTIETALINALGTENGTDILEKIIKNNPSLSSTTTRLQVRQMSSWRARAYSKLMAPSRSSTPWPQSARNKKSTLFSTTMCPKQDGVATHLMATRGGETPTSPPLTGPVDSHIWPSM
jgi:hypothetical protein